MGCSNAKRADAVWAVTVLDSAQPFALQQVVIANNSGKTMMIGITDRTAEHSG